MLFQKIFSVLILQLQNAFLFIYALVYFLCIYALRVVQLFGAYGALSTFDPE